MHDAAPSPSPAPSLASNTIQPQAQALPPPQPVINPPLTSAQPPLAPLAASTTGTLAPSFAQRPPLNPSTLQAISPYQNTRIFTDAQGQPSLTLPLKPKSGSKKTIEEQLKEIREIYDAELKGPTALPPKGSLKDIVGQVDANEVLDKSVEEILLEMADDFIDSVTAFGCKLAKHRGSTTMEVKDLHYHLERNWNLRIPGFNSSEIRMIKKGPTATHLLRVSNIKKAQKDEQLNLARQRARETAVAVAAGPNPVTVVDVTEGPVKEEPGILMEVVNGEEEGGEDGKKTPIDNGEEIVEMEEAAGDAPPPAEELAMDLDGCEN
ncbi:transcription initiation factor TFIID subunit A-domain-containing protein [Chytridium lagenaria]|nr:transcription initiation factor TFIID subunit A-domain-containing protein [Chytridium lagenaria]